MAEFPDIEDPSKVTETDISFRLKQTSSAGYTMITAQGTATKKEFLLEWDVLTSADKATLSAFFITNNSLVISWTHFETSVEYSAIFKDDKLKFSYIAPDYWKVKLTLLEQ